MACVSSCPSGVRYDRLIEATRAAVEEEYRPPARRARRPRRCSSASSRTRGACARRSRSRRSGGRCPCRGGSARWSRSRRPGAAEATWRRSRRAEGAAAAASGCSPAASSSAVFPDVNAATARVLAADGFEVVAPPQGCCGALSVHAGRLEEGKTVRPRRSSGRSTNVDVVVVNASGCGSHLKELGWLLGDESARRSPRRCATSASFSRTSRRARARHPLAAAGRAPGSVPPPPRPGAAAARSALARPHPGARGRRAGRAGALLRLRRDLQHRPARGRARARRPQGGARPRDGRAGLREREPGLPRPGLAGAAPREAAAAGAAPDRARRRLDPQRRRGRLLSRARR